MDFKMDLGPVCCNVNLTVGGMVAAPMSFQIFFALEQDIKSSSDVINKLQEKTVLVQKYEKSGLV